MPTGGEKKTKQKAGAVLSITEPPLPPVLLPHASSGHLCVFSLLMEERATQASVLFNERSKQTGGHNSDLLLFGGGKGRELVKE